MSARLRSVPQIIPPQSPQRQDWMWDGDQWCPPCDGRPMPPPCPPTNFPTPCPPWFPPPATQPPWYPGANGGISFSPTPPPNPIRGHLWWDGDAFRMFDGAVWIELSTASRGVTDGSDAAPGDIGEFIYGAFSFAYTANPALTQQTVPTLTIAPGDWDLWAFMTFSTNVGGVAFFLPSPPAGISNNLPAFNILGSSSQVAQYTVIASPVARGNFTVPTLLTFSATVDQAESAGLPAGTATLILEGRRVR